MMLPAHRAARRTRVHMFDVVLNSVRPDLLSRTGNYSLVFLVRHSPRSFLPNTDNYSRVLRCEGMGAEN